MSDSLSMIVQGYPVEFDRITPPGRRTVLAYSYTRPSPNAMRVLKETAVSLWLPWVAESACVESNGDYWVTHVLLFDRDPRELWGEVGAWNAGFVFGHYYGNAMTCLGCYRPGPEPTFWNTSFRRAKLDAWMKYVARAEAEGRVPSLAGRRGRIDTYRPKVGENGWTRSS